MHTITKIQAREILDSRGYPTVEVDLALTSGVVGRAAVPSGASTGSYEALELRDNDKNRYGGKGVRKAVANIGNLIAPSILNKKFDQKSLDMRLLELDGTKDKSKLGANAILGVSLAFSRAAAMREKAPLYEYFNRIEGSNRPLVLPVPLINVLNGGRHAIHATDIQEFMVVPLGAPTFAEALRYGAETFHALKKIVAARGYSTAVGDEGGFAVPLSTNREALDLLMSAIQSAGFKPGKDVSIAIDVAASEFYKNGAYVLHTEKKTFSTANMNKLYAEWVSKYPLISIEDGLAEDDWAGYEALTAALGKKVQIVGDDLFVTNVERLTEGIKRKAANAILIKLNQIGTVSETIETVTLARANGYGAIISNRSGETEDASIADLAVGLGCGQIKTGSTSRGERTAKYNQLLRIEEVLGKKSRFAGADMLKRPA